MHSVHLNRLVSPRCRLSCTRQWSLRLKRLSQNVQANAGSAFNCKINKKIGLEFYELWQRNEHCYTYVCIHVLLQAAFQFECFWTLWTLFETFIKVGLPMFRQRRRITKSFPTQITQQIGVVVLKMQKRRDENPQLMESNKSYSHLFAHAVSDQTPQHRPLRTEHSVWVVLWNAASRAP